MQRILLLLALSAPAFAGEFTPPQGCKLDMTVQFRQCQVANHYLCDDAPNMRFISYADGEGEFYLSQIDTETRWVKSTDRETGEIELLDENSPDHASFSTMLDQGRDTYDFRTSTSLGMKYRYRGSDTATGETKVIDGVTLSLSQFDLTAYDADGNMAHRRSGQEFYLPERRVFLSGTEQFESADGSIETISAPPMSFAFEGEKGFGDAKPKYDCDALMTRNDQDPLSEEAL